MDIAVAGAHGQIARRLVRLLAERGDVVRGLIRNPAHAVDVRADGGQPAVCDLERSTVEEVALTIEGADAVVFAAGAGPGSGAERKATMDRDGALLLLGAAIAARVPEYVMISAMGTEEPPAGDDVFSVYLRAKADADRALMESDRRWTIVRPGGLTDEPGTGRVALARHLPRGEVPREDVAAVVAAILHDHRTAGRIFTLTAGDQPIPDALDVAITADPRDDG